LHPEWICFSDKSDTKFLSTFMTEHGKIVPRRVTGNAAHIQRHLAQEIKRARALALLGFVAIGPNGAN
jgi:small subunit ribosomal protein S18